MRALLSALVFSVTTAHACDDFLFYPANFSFAVEAADGTKADRAAAAVQARLVALLFERFGVVEVAGDAAPPPFVPKYAYVINPSRPGGFFRGADLDAARARANRFLVYLDLGTAHLRLAASDRVHAATARVLRQMIATGEISSFEENTDLSDGVVTRRCRRTGPGI